MENAPRRVWAHRIGTFLWTWNRARKGLEEIPFFPKNLYRFSIYSQLKNFARADQKNTHFSRFFLKKTKRKIIVIIRVLLEERKSFSLSQALVAALPVHWAEIAQGRASPVPLKKILGKAPKARVPRVYWNRERRKAAKTRRSPQTTLSSAPSPWNRCWTRGP